MRKAVCSHEAARGCICKPAAAANFYTSKASLFLGNDLLLGSGFVIDWAGVNVLSWLVDDVPPGAMKAGMRV